MLSDRDTRRPAVVRGPAVDLAALIEAHGYWVLAIGSLLEGETVLLLAGFAAHRGHLDFALVLAIAAACGFAGDMGWFWIGRRHGERVLVRRPRLAAQAARVHTLLERWHAWVIVGVRFAYGLRIAGPLLIGMSPLPAARFAVFNALGAAVWALAVGGLGWLFGQAAEAALGRARHLEGWLLLALALAAAGVWRLRRGRARRAAPPR